MFLSKGNFNLFAYSNIYVLFLCFAYFANRRDFGAALLTLTVINAVSFSATNILSLFSLSAWWLGFKFSLASMAHN